MSRLGNFVRNMSGGVKGIRYKVEQLNKYMPTESSRYGIPYPVIRSRSISVDNSKKNNKSINSKSMDTSINSYLEGQYNIFNISNRTHIMVSGKDCKDYVSLLTTCDNKIMDFGTTRKSLALKADGTMLGVGLVNRWNNYYSVIMDGGTDNTLQDHFFDNKVGFDISLSRNITDDLYLFKGPGSLKVINSIMNYLKNNSNKGCKVIDSLNYQSNINFANSLTPNNSFSVINTPQGYIMKINKHVVDRVFNNLNLFVSSETDYETNRIEAGQPCFTRDLMGDYNPIEANLHSHFAKNYKYSKRGSLGSSFYGKNPLFSEHGTFKRFPRTRVMLYSCDKGLIPPEDSVIYSNGVKVGNVTSSSSSTYLRCIVAMGYVHLEKTFKTRSFSLARDMVKKVEINGNSYFIKFL